MKNSNSRLLIVENDSSLAHLVKRLIDRSNEEFDYQMASSGEEAAKLAREYDPHVILTDYNMLGMNGVELMLELKGLYGYSGKAVLWTSSSLTANDVRRDYAGLFDSVFEKPSDPVEFKRILDEVVLGYLPKPEMAVV